MRKVFSFALMGALLLAGCSKPATISQQVDQDKVAVAAQDDAQLASMGITAESISLKQGWSIEATKAQMQFMKDCEAKKPVSDEEWRIVEASGKKFGRSYISGLAGYAASNPKPEIRKTGLEWSHQLMDQTEDPYAVALGYHAFAVSGEPGREELSANLQARSPEQKKIILESEEGLRRHGYIK